MLKALLDRNYALGINRLFYHVYVHNPWLDRKPGMTLDGIGLFFQRDQTWWNKGAKALSDYATRCQALLQYGHPVVDIAVFTGEEIPKACSTAGPIGSFSSGDFRGGAGVKSADSSRKKDNLWCKGPKKPCLGCGEGCGGGCRASGSRYRW